MQVVAFGTATFSSTSEYQVAFNADSIPPVTAQVGNRPRRGRFPVRDSLHGSSRQMELMVYRKNGGSTPTSTFWPEIYSIFNPILGTRNLKIVHDRTGGTIITPVDVVSVVQDSNAYMQMFKVVVEAQDPIWYDSSSNTTGSLTASSGTFSNTGDIFAFPTITVDPTPSGNSLCSNYRFTFSDNSGRGVSNHWVHFSLSTGSFTTASNFIIFYKGRSIPFNYVNNAGTGHFDIRIDIPPNGSTFVDLFFGTPVNNTTTSNKFDLGQSYSDPATSNASHRFANSGTNSWLVSSAPANADFVWTPGIIGNNVSGVTFGIINEGGGSCVLAVRPSGIGQDLANDANALICTVGNSLDSNGLTYLYRILSMGKVPGTETQRLNIDVNVFGGTLLNSNLSGGGFKLQTTAGKTANIPYNCTSSTIQTALESLSDIGAGNVSVSGPNVSGANGYDISYIGNLTYSTVEVPTVVENTLAVTYLDGGGGTVTSTPVPTSLSRVTEGIPNHSRGFLKFRTANQVNWSDYWASTQPGTVNGIFGTGIDNLSGAVQIAIGIEALASTANGTIVIQSTPSQYTTLTLTGYPTYTSTSASAYKINNSFVIASGYGENTPSRVTYLTDVYCTAPITIDCYNQLITVSSGPLYGAISFSDPDLWMTIGSGTNAYSTVDTNNSRPTYTWLNRWLL